MSETKGLIISKETTRLRLFRPRPAPEPGIALVLFREGQPLVTLWPGDRLTSGEVSWGNYKTVYKVDITEHSFSFSCTLPCQGEAFEFHTQVDVTYSIENPNLIVERNITDARTVLEPLVVNTMREISREHDVEQSAEAEKSITERVLEESKKYSTGLKILRFMVKLSLEEDARNHIRQLKQIERTKVSERRQAELEKQRIELEVERTKMRMEFYSPLIKEGQWQLLALQLANHPDDVAAIAQMIRQQRQADMENQLRALKIMLEEDVIEGFQMEEASKRVLQRFVDSFGPDLEVRALGSGEKPKALEAKQDSQNES
ncbi:MAG TPA: hypothetical protein ENN36_04740 [Candidatus Bathyarchaeota archaeon]|nr:hypothetical protein [Candidatus Bathyarchaeota archaeon]